MSVTTGNLDVLENRLRTIGEQIKLAENFDLILDRDKHDVPDDPFYEADGRWYFQIKCYRRDAITGEMGYGTGGKGFISEHMTLSEIVQLVFGLYKGYWEHEARETFQWNDRRIFGPHISVEALHEVARRVDVRSANHEEDQR